MVRGPEQWRLSGPLPSPSLFCVVFLSLPESQCPHLPISGWSLFPPTHPKFTAQVLWIQVTISFLLMTELAAGVLQLGQGPPATTLTALREVLIVQPLSMCIALDPYACDLTSHNNQWNNSFLFYSSGNQTFKRGLRTPLVGPAVKTPHFQCRGHRFDPWSGN